MRTGYSKCRRITPSSINLSIKNIAGMLFSYLFLSCYYYAPIKIYRIIIRFLTIIFIGLCQTQQSNVIDSLYFCQRCLHFCNREESYKEHIKRCKKHSPQNTIFLKIAVDWDLDRLCNLTNGARTPIFRN